MKKIITKIITFISFLLVTMEAFNKIVLYLFKTKNKVQPLADKTYDWKFGTIKYLSKGKGEPLLLVHDMVPGSSSLEWKKVIELLSKKYHVYALDLPGFGTSDKEIKTYTNYLYITAICDFISDIIKEKTTIVTSGEAANIAVLSAYQNKILFDKLVFINPNSMEDYKMIPDKNDSLIKKLYSLPIIGTFIYLLNILKCKDLNDDYLFASYYNGENARYYYGSYIGNYVNFPIHHRINKISVPLLLIAGKKFDDIYDILSEYSDYTDNSDIIENASRFPHIEEPEAFCKSLDILLHCDYNM